MTKEDSVCGTINPPCFFTILILVCFKKNRENSEVLSVKGFAQWEFRVSQQCKIPSFNRIVFANVVQRDNILKHVELNDMENTAIVMSHNLSGRVKFCNSFS